MSAMADFYIHCGECGTIPMTKRDRRRWSRQTGLALPVVRGVYQTRTRGWMHYTALPLAHAWELYHPAAGGFGFLSRSEHRRVADMLSCGADCYRGEEEPTHSAAQRLNNRQALAAAAAAAEQAGDALRQLAPGLRQLVAVMSRIRLLLAETGPGPV